MPAHGMASFIKPNVIKVLHELMVPQCFFPVSPTSLTEKIFESGLKTHIPIPV